METEQREEKKSCPGTPLFMGSRTVQPAPLLRPHGSEKVHCRHKQLSWRPGTGGRGDRNRGVRREIRSGRGGLDAQGGGNDGGEAAKEKGTDWKEVQRTKGRKRTKVEERAWGGEKKRWETAGPTGHQGPSLYSSTPSEAERVG